MTSLNDLAYKVSSCFQIFGIVSSWADFCVLADQDPLEPDFKEDDLALLIFHHQISHGDTYSGFFHFGTEIAKYDALLNDLSGKGLE